MVVEQVDIETGEVFSRTRTAGHGWASPDEAVRHWRSLTNFSAYMNGRVITNADTGLEARAYFVPSHKSLVPDPTPPESANGSNREKQADRGQR